MSGRTALCARPGGHGWSRKECSIQGYLGHSLRKCIEQENKYILLVDWEKLEDHTIGFRQSEHYLEWKELLHHYYDPFPIVEHFEMILENKNNK